MNALENLDQLFPGVGIKKQNIIYFKNERMLYLHLESNQIIPQTKIEQAEKKLTKKINGDVRVMIKPHYILEGNSRQILDEYQDNLFHIISQVCPSTKYLKKRINLNLSKDETVVDIVTQDQVIYSKLLEKNIIYSLRNKMEEECSLDLGFTIQLQDEPANNSVYFQEKAKSLKNMLADIKEDTSDEKKNVPRAEKTKDSKDFKQKKFSKKETEYQSLKIEALTGNDFSVTIIGEIFSVEKRELKSGRVLEIFAITDYTGSIFAKRFMRKDDISIEKGDYVKLSGDVVMDAYMKEMAFMVKGANKEEKLITREDSAPRKRVELHCHTNMSAMDAIPSAKEIIKKAVEFGHSAVAITDHGVVQAFPEAMEAGAKNNIKILYGVEGYLLDDCTPIAENLHDKDFEGDFVVFDIETTGLSIFSNKLLEIGAVKISKGIIIDTFSALIDPLESIPPKITELTGITESMVKNKRTFQEVLPEFLSFAGTSVMVAHNSSFDMGFIREKSREIGIEFENLELDTLQMARYLFPKLKKHKLDVVAKHLGISLDNHHRAVNDAQATAEIFLKFLEILREKGIQDFNGLQETYKETEAKNQRTNHIILFAQNETGLKNLYQLISASHLYDFYRTPRILKSRILQHREGLLIGSACENGEIFQAIQRGMSKRDVEKRLELYDYIEIMPIDNNKFMIEKELSKDEDELRLLNWKLAELGKKNKKLVVATSDAHFIHPYDSVFRGILQHSLGFKNSEESSPLFFKTTNEMLEEFSYLGQDYAYEVVVENTNLIADSIEVMKPIPDGTFPPIIEGSDKELREMCYSKAKSIYGEVLPEIVESRLERELSSIIGNGYAVMYIIAQKLVTKSIRDGYLVGSRGSVGSSLAATMSDITEVNPLCPHYICKHCKNSEFITDGSYGSGPDLPDKTCPTCGQPYQKEGYDIPFEVFLGFEGDKEPDIDLNFAGEYQPQAHKYTEELFGSGSVFRAGTIGTIADKTAYGFAKKYLEEREIHATSAEVERLKDGCTGIKRTSGQHPGGVMIVPSYKDIHDFTPVQYPANDATSGVITTHFDYHSISGRILKLDILGHDVPSVIKMLEDMTGVDATQIPLDDPETMSLFTSTEALQCTLEELDCQVGSLGIPEFGTKFVRQMLKDTNPHTFAELIRISGLSHGELVWVGNAQDLVREGTAELKDVISTRDDIMNYLILQGMNPKMSFKIMENVRKGKGLTEEFETAMKEAKIPEWYIESCKRIKYMFPKAHAAAYVMMSFRIAYFKVHHKEAFYATYFTTKAEDFDLEIISKGKGAILEKLKEIDKLGKEATAKEKNLYTVLEVAFEMLQRKVELDNLDIYNADAKKFGITAEGKLLPPLISVQGLGETVALNIARESEKEYLSLEDFRKRTKATKTVIDTLVNIGCLDNLSETNQLSLF